MVLIGELVKTLNLYSNLRVGNHSHVNKNSNARGASKKFWMQNAQSNCVLLTWSLCFIIIFFVIIVLWFLFTLFLGFALHNIHAFHSRFFIFIFMNQLKKHILFFDFLENHYVSKDEVSKQHLNMIKKSNFVKADKTIVRSSHLPFETVLITCQDQKTEVKASPFKIADDQTPITSIIEQNDFTNESLHVIGQ